MTKHIKVDIFARPATGDGGSGGYEFSMEKGNSKTNQLVFDKTKDGMKKTDHYEIKFRLHNENGANLSFSKDITNVLWAEPTDDPNPPCPTSQQMDGVFYVKKQSDIKAHELTVTNTDPTKQRFIFAFNFLRPGESDPPQSGYVLYDPIGSNEDGGLSFQRSTAMVVTVGAIAVAGIFFVVYRALM